MSLDVSSESHLKLVRRLKHESAIAIHDGQIDDGCRCWDVLDLFADELEFQGCFRGPWVEQGGWHCGGHVVGGDGLDAG